MNDRKQSSPRTAVSIVMQDEKLASAVKAQREEKRRKQEELDRRYAAAASVLRQDAAKFADDAPWTVLAPYVTQHQVPDVNFPEFEVRFNGELIGMVGFAGVTWWRYARPYYRQTHLTCEEAVEGLVRIALRELRK